MDDINNEAFVAFAKAGLDKEFTLFRIYTRRLVDEKTGEVGVFEFKFQHPLELFEQQLDPVGFLKVVARAYIQHGVQQTRVPIEAWIVEFSPIMERYNIPSHLYLDTSRDRAWLA